MRPGPDRRLVRFAGRVPPLERAQAAKVPGRTVGPDRIGHRGQRHRGNRTGHGESGELRRQAHRHRKKERCQIAHTQMIQLPIL